MTAPTDRLTLPNAISLARLLLAPFALWVAWRGEATLYKWLFAIAVASDLADGLLARLLRQQTVLGARLDAVADTATYLVLWFAVTWLWPDFIAAHLHLIIAVLCMYAANHLFALVRFHKLPAYHTWAGKTSAVLMATGMLTWFVTGAAWIFTIALLVSIASVLEQFAITALLPHWAADVPTVVRAWQLRKGGPPPGRAV
jgi:phosphatidylglycerophosphate synthase